MKAKEKLTALRGLVSNAQANGSLRRELAQAFWDIAGHGDEAATPVAAPVETTVTITLRVTGNASSIPAAASREVEAALAGVARRVSLTVVPGSVSVRAS